MGILEDSVQATALSIANIMKYCVQAKKIVMVV